MGLRFTSQLLVDQIPDEQLEDRWEVIMPTLNLNTPYIASSSASSAEEEGFWNKTKQAAKNLGNSLGDILTGQTYCPIVEEITFKPQGFKNEARRVRTQYINVPGDIEAPYEINICMYCPGSMLTQYYIEAWKRLVYNPYGEYYNQQNVYKKNIEVYFEAPFSLPNAGTLVGSNAADSRMCSCHFTLHGCYPTVQDVFKLTYASNPKRLRIVQKFMCDRITLENNLKTAGIIESIASLGTNAVDGLLTQLSTHTSAFNQNNVYNFDTETANKTIFTADNTTTEDY